MVMESEKSSLIFALLVQAKRASQVKWQSFWNLLISVFFDLSSSSSSPDLPISQISLTLLPATVTGEGGGHFGQPAIHGGPFLPNKLGRGKEMERVGRDSIKTLKCWALPTNNALLIMFRLSSDAEILLKSTDWAYKSAPNVQKLVRYVYIFRLSFHFACHRWWLGWRSWMDNYFFSLEADER